MVIAYRQLSSIMTKVKYQEELSERKLRHEKILFSLSLDGVRTCLQKGHLLVVTRPLV